MPGLITYSHPADNLPSTTREALALGFRTTLPNAVLVRIDSNTFEDYIEIELVRQALKGLTSNIIVVAINTD
jgi:leucine-rich repeat transmembrane neuronal protein 1/2